MTHGNGVSRGDRNRNARLARLRKLVPLDHAIVAIDLADKKQMVVVCDHDSRVLARKTFRCRAWDLGVALDWAAQRATAKGWVGVSVSCEPTGHRWRVLGQLAADRSMPFVCVQPMVTSWARGDHRGVVVQGDTSDDHNHRMRSVASPPLQLIGAVTPLAPRVVRALRPAPMPGCVGYGIGENGGDNWAGEKAGGVVAGGLNYAIYDMDIGWIGSD